MKISVIMPVYNCEEYLEKAINSVLRQGIDDLEIIAVEDKSTDASAKILRDIAEKEPRVKAHFNEKNSGVAAVRNTALEMASGEYVAFCDSDDIVPDGAYLGMLSDIGSADVLICAFCDVSDAGGIRTSFVNKRDKKSLFRALFSVSCLWNKLFRRESLSGLKFDEDMKIGEDVVFLSHYVVRQPKYSISDRIVYHHCHHESASTPSLTHIYTYNTFVEHIKCREKLLDICISGGIGECYDYVFNYFIEYIDRFLLFIDGMEDKKRAFELYRAFIKRYDWENRGDAFRALTGVDYSVFLACDVNAYIQLKYDALPRDRVLYEFREGKIGLRWIVKYFLGWFKFKFSKKG